MDSTPEEANIGPSQEHAYAPYFTPPPSRLRSLDIMKGLAVLVGLFFSIFMWAGISKGMQGQVLMQKHGATHVLQVLVTFLVEDKLRSLLIMAFGASMLLMLARQHKDTIYSAQELVIRRNFLLLVFGIINGILLLWPMDILYGIGIVGVIYFAFARMDKRGLMILAFLTMLIGSGKIYWHYHDDQKAWKKYIPVEAKEKKIKADSAKLKDSLKTGFKKTDTLTRKEKEYKDKWEGVSKKYAWEKKNDSGQIKALQDGRWTKVYDTQLKTTQQRESWWFYQFGFWYFSAALLMGMMLFKDGFFSGKYAAWQYLVSFLILTAGSFFLFRYRMHGWMDVIKDYPAFVKRNPLPMDFFRPFEMIFGALAYASVIMFFVRKQWMTKLGDVLVKVGRMALTLYIFQSIVLGVMMYGFGMGYYARINQNWLYFIVLELILVQVVFAILWLRYFRMGPVEWLLISLAKKKRLKIAIS
jgi:uncharacterized protein